jgi:Calx-beta domain
MTVPSIEPLESRIAPAVISLVSPGSLNEGTVNAAGESPTTPFVFKVQLDIGVSGTVSFHAKIKAGGTATTGVDFVDIGDMLVTLAPGDRDHDITVLVNKDNTFENGGVGETFIVELSDLTTTAVGTTVSFGTGNPSTLERTATILNDDARPTLAFERDVKVDEGDAGPTDAVFRAKLSNPADEAITFDWLTAFSGEPNAANGADFTPVSTTTVTIPAGDLFSPNLTVVVAGDTVDEREEEFLVRTSNAQLATNTPDVFEPLTITDAEAKGLIGNDEVRVQIAGNPSVIEGNTGSRPAAFTVSLAGGTTRAYPITVNVKVSGDGLNPASAGTDVVATASVVIPAGQTGATLNVGVLGDLIFEGDETFLVTLDNVVNAAIDPGANTATGTILADNDVRPAVSILPPAIAALNEGSTENGKTDFQFRARLSQPSSEAVKVVLSLGGTADGDDYVIETQPNVTMLTATTFEVNIPAGQQETSFIVKVKHDRMFEADETIVAVIGTPTNASLGTTTAQATIRNDEDVPQLKVINDARAEGTGVADTQFIPRVQLVDAAGNPMSADRAITFDWQTIGGTALAGSDFAAQNVTGATISAGQTEVGLSIPVVADDVDEEDEAFTVTIGNAVLGGTTSLALAGATATVTIQNDDLTVSIPGGVTFTEDQGDARGDCGLRRPG